MLELHEISKTFSRDGAAPVVALERINLRFSPGEFCTIVGNNGCGKSTLLNIVDGVIKPDQGRILWNGRAVDSLPSVERQRLAAKVHQNPDDGTARTLTVAENLALAMLAPGRAGLRRLVNSGRSERIKATLDDLDIGLNGRQDAIIQSLSGGQRQALAVHMAVLSDPKILLLDEHTAALDPEHAERVMDLTIRLWKEKELTVLMVTHNLDEALRYGDRLLCMSQGKIYADIKAKEKKTLTVSDLLDLFKRKKREGFILDSSFML